MIRPVELSDVLGKAQAVERAQHADKTTEDANQKQAQAFAEHLQKRALGEANPTNKDENVDDAPDERKKHDQEKKKRSKNQKEPDKDEKEMTHLGFKIDVVA